MKIITTEFKQYCLSKFDSISEGEKVYLFYKQLESKQSSKTKSSLLERRKSSLDYLLSNYNAQAIIDTINTLERKKKSGEYYINTIAYFNKCVENTFKQKSSVVHQNTLFLQQNITDIIAPIQIKFLRESTIDALQWLYSCPKCKTEFDGFNESCPGCKSLINWKLIKKE